MAHTHEPCPGVNIFGIFSPHSRGKIFILNFEIFVVSFGIFVLNFGISVLTLRFLPSTFAFFPSTVWGEKFWYFCQNIYPWPCLLDDSRRRRRTHVHTSDINGQDRRRPAFLGKLPVSYLFTEGLPDSFFKTTSLCPKGLT